MSGFGDVKTKKFLNLIEWLRIQKGIEIKQGGKHIKVTCIHSGESYPIPVSHRIINKHIVKRFMQWLIQNEICTEEEYKFRL